MINVRRAEIKDIPMIMQFLDDHWLKGYALAHNRELFDWQFVKDGKVNIWIGVDDEEGKMYAMQGGIFYSSEEHADVSGMLWIAAKSENPFLAIEVTDSMYTETTPRSAFSMGLMPRAVKVIKKRGENVGYFEHYYRLANRDNYKIAVVRDKIIPPAFDCGYKLRSFVSINDFKNVIAEKDLMGSSPSKDYRYIEWRYWKHPVFKYDKWIITAPDGKDVAVLISREESYLDSKACKIVDYYGESVHLGNITTELDRIISEKSYEYIDIYSFGVPRDIYEQGGFVRCDGDSDNIITNHFQPYAACNSDIALIIPYTSNARLFRGDSDQDKPRL